MCIRDRVNTVFLDETKTSPTLNLDDIWKKVIAMLELPSTKMLLSQQAKLINLNSDSAEIAISEKWINMIQSRKNLIEDAFYKARGSSTKVVLIQQKDNLSNHKKVEDNLQKKYPQIIPICASFEDLSLEPNSIDRMFCRWSLAWVQDPNKIIRKIKNYLKKQNYLF